MSPHIFETRKRNTQTRYEKVRNKVNELYNEKRLRYDDVIKKVAEDFVMSERTIRNILKKPTEKVMQPSNQTSLF